MKKIIVASVLASLLLPLAVLATANEPGQITSLELALGKIRSGVWQIFAALAVIMFVIAGIEFLTAQGDPEKLQKARSFFLWGVMGVAVAVIGYSVLYVVQTYLVG